jgi:hypothetical protein
MQVQENCRGIPSSILETARNTLEDLRDQGMSYEEAVLEGAMSCPPSNVQLECQACMLAIVNEVYAR